MGDQLHIIVEDWLGDDARRALIAYHRLVDDELPWIEQRVVGLARRDGWSWARIGRLLVAAARRCRSGSSAWHRFAAAIIAPSRCATRPSSPGCCEVSDPNPIQSPGRELDAQQEKSKRQPPEPPRPAPSPRRPRCMGTVG